MRALLLLSLAALPACLEAEARPIAIGTELRTDGGVRFVTGSAVTIAPPNGSTNPLTIASNVPNTTGAVGVEFNNATSLTNADAFVLLVRNGGSSIMGVNANGVSVDNWRGITASSPVSIQTNGSVASGTKIVQINNGLTESFTFYQTGSWWSIAGTLDTCNSSREGHFQRDAAGGGATGARTRLCLCTSNGSSVYAWQNITSGTVGTATTCSP